ncbi:hypothetical protein V1264_016982 [Littorina saxatilis]|uniref:CUB domain-containing protein n=1 Tax=Littorina saxatilis TaxID=31220 RepID=A0AAN9BGC1_9CAEN
MYSYCHWTLVLQKNTTIWFSVLDLDIKEDCETGGVIISWTSVNGARQAKLCSHSNSTVKPLEVSIQQNQPIIISFRTGSSWSSGSRFSLQYLPTPGMTYVRIGRNNRVSENPKRWKIPVL